MEGIETISSPADLSASFDTGAAATETTDITAAPAQDGMGDDLSEPISPDAETDLEELNAGSEGDTAQAEQEADSAEEQPEEQQAEAADSVEEALPDGVRRVSDGKGGFKYHLNQHRYELFHGAHKQLREFSEQIGEALTPEAFDVRNRAYLGQERLFNDMLSGDPSAQTNVVNHFLDEAAQAQSDGSVEGNPMVPFTQSFYSAIQEKNPEAYAALRMLAAKDLVEELYSASIENGGNRSLFLSVGHAAKALGLPYKTEAEMQDFFAKGANQDPMANLRAENARLQAQLNGKQADTRTQQFKDWKVGTTNTVTAAVGQDAVMAGVADFAKQGIWPQNQSAFHELVVKPLNSAVVEALNKDSAFQDRIAILDRQAKMATSEQRRAQIRQDIADAHVKRAKLTVDAVKADILKNATATLKGQSDATHQRRANSQTQRAPASTGTAVRRSLVPNGGSMDFDVANPASLKASLQGLF